MERILSILLLLYFGVSCGYGYTCLDEKGQPVAWFIALKPPNGLQYAYMDENSKVWKTSNYKINSKEGFFYNTLNQLYSNFKDEKSLHVMYNDSPPNEKWDDNLRYFLRDFPDMKDSNLHKDSEYGHMKGVTSFKKEQKGFWMVHSAPKVPGKYKFSYNSSASIYGQSFVCVTFNYERLKTIVQQLLVGRPLVYRCNASEIIKKDIPEVKQLCNLKTISQSSEKKRSSVAVFDKKITHFCKSSEFNEDLYSGLVAPNLRKSLFVETWRRQPLPSNCSSQYKTFNINEFKSPINNQKITSTRDHSKWAVTDDGSTVCIGDINRIKTQFKRGGGTLCISDSNVARKFRELVSGYDKCEDFFEWSLDFDLNDIL